MPRVASLCFLACALVGSAAGVLSPDGGHHLLGDPNAPQILVALRQSAFDLGVQQALYILDNHMLKITIPEVTKSFNVPVVGEFTLHIKDLVVKEFLAPSDATDLLVMDGFFHLRAQQVSAYLTFDWAWESQLGLHGSGSGELRLKGGAVDYAFEVAGDPATQTPVVHVKAADARFESLELNIHSASADWLYQAVLKLFNDQVKGLVQRGVRDALSHDVPDAINKVLGTLPTHMDVHGLPFSTSFDYSIYTLAYVLIKGYGQVQSSPSARSTGPKLLPGLQQRQQELQSVMVRCPFEATPLPISPPTIGLDPHMVTFYAHESMAGCLLWGLYEAGALAASVVDGTVPGLRLTTDVLAMLIPQLPKAYPHQLVRIDGAATAMPLISLSKDSGTTIQVGYRSKVYVDNATLGTPLVATMVGNVSITGFVSWASTTILSVKATHSVEYAAPGMNIDPTKWDGTVGWVISNYGPLYPLQQLYKTFVKSPVASLFSLTNTAAQTMDGWWALSADVQVQLPAT